MRLDNAPFYATLNAAAGDNTDLQAELRLAFCNSAKRQVDLLDRSRCDGNWHMAAMRLKAIAASFHSNDLIDLAQEALSGAPGDPVILRRLKAACVELSGDSA